MAQQILKIGLFENALHFFQSAVKQLPEPKQGLPTPTADRWAVKDALLGLATTIELVLKHCLFNEHWALIFEDINTADKKAFLQAHKVNLQNVPKKGGLIKTVSFENAVERAERVLGKNLPENHKATINALRFLRNQIQHFHVETSQQEAWKLVLKAFYVVRWLVEKFKVLDTASPTEKQAYYALKQTVERHEEYKKSRMADLQPLLEQRAISRGFKVAVCPQCLCKAIPLISENLECLYCEKEIRYPTPDTVGCPGCQEEGIFAYELDNGAKCFLCNKSFTLDDLKKSLGGEPIIECPKCGQRELYIGKLPDPVLCFFCWSVFEKEGLEEALGPSFEDQKEGNTGWPLNCPECGHSDSYYPCGDMWVCLECKETASDEEFSICESCGQPWSPPKNWDLPMCQECWDDLCERNDFGEKD